MKDRLIFDLIEKECQRQQENIELIASENYVSKEIRDVTGSILTNKYAEGYPGRRYYGGCDYVDEIEEIARERLCTLFQAEHANVQPHSGSQANMAVYLAMLEYHDRVLGMDLSSGGHLTHGHRLNFSGKSYEFFSYGVDPETETIDYDDVARIAREIKPKLIIAGASAYSRTIDYARFRQIADEVGAYLMVDMAHIAGLVVAKLHPNPVEYADFVTTTTHKTLRGPRGGAILCKKKYAAAIDRSVFPGVQGGPLVHVIAGKAICFYEALQPSFVDYQNQVVRNAQALQRTLLDCGFRLVANGTDTHLLLIDVKAGCDLNGKHAETLLDQVSITCNKNAIPFDKEKPMVTSGIRIGTPAMTTRGFREAEFEQVARWISEVLHDPNNFERHQKIKEEVLSLTSRFPIE